MSRAYVVNEPAPCRKVPAKDLRPGDFCVASRQTVLGVAVGVRTPTGKVEVTLERENGTRRVAHWNRSTRIGVRRAGSAAELGALPTDRKRALIDAVIDEAIEA